MPRMHGDARNRALRGLTALYVAATLLGFVGGWWWVLDLLAHFRVLYVVGGLAGLGALLWHRQRWEAAVTAVALAINLATIVGLYGPTPSDASPSLRVVSFNIHSGSETTKAAAEHIASLDPDVVVLIEPSDRQIAAFGRILSGYETVGVGRDNPYGIAVLSRLPLEGKVTTLGPSWAPAVLGTLGVGDARVALAAIHAPPPVGGDASRGRDELIRNAAAWAIATGLPALVVGDVNCTPWSAVQREVVAGELQTTQRFGIQGTWPAWLGPLALPIDHGFTAGGLTVVRREVGRSLGSDHRLLLVDLAIPARAPAR